MPWPVWAFWQKLLRLLGRRSGQEKADRPRPFTEADRIAQLSEFADLCARLADAFSSHGEHHAAGLIGPLHDRALHVRDVGWQQKDLTELGGSYPECPVSWVDPRMADYQAPRESWQEDVARWHERARELSIELRAIAA